MNGINMPGFTAEHSLMCRSNRHSYGGVSDTSYTIDAEIIPQDCILLDGMLVCSMGEDPGDGPKGVCARCLGRCFGMRHGPKREACLRYCHDEVC